MPVGTARSLYPVAHGQVCQPQSLLQLPEKSRSQSTRGACSMADSILLLIRQLCHGAPRPVVALEKRIVTKSPAPTRLRDNAALA